MVAGVKMMIVVDQMVAVVATAGMEPANVMEHTTNLQNVIAKAHVPKQTILDLDAVVMINVQTVVLIVVKQFV